MITTDCGCFPKNEKKSIPKDSRGTDINLMEEKSDEFIWCSKFFIVAIEKIGPNKPPIKTDFAIQKNPKLYSSKWGMIWGMIFSLRPHTRDGFPSQFDGDDQHLDLDVEILQEKGFRDKTIHLFVGGVKLRTPCGLKGEDYLPQYHRIFWSAPQKMWVGGRFFGVECE